MPYICEFKTGFPHSSWGGGGKHLILDVSTWGRLAGGCYDSDPGPNAGAG